MPEEFKPGCQRPAIKKVNPEAQTVSDLSTKTCYEKSIAHRTLTSEKGF